mgnify:CR=1 FL=1
MTFSTKVKNELCKISRPFNDSSIKLLYGLLLFSRNFKASDISFYTENKNVSELICDLILQNFGCIVDIISSNKVKENLILKIPYAQDRQEILKKFGVLDDKINLKINNDLLKTQNDLKLFLRGVFLTCGTVTDPQNGYHLEFSVPYMNLSKCLVELLSSIKSINLKVKSTVRKGNFVVYIKDSADITDFLTYVGASTSAMDFMQVKMVKEVRNYVNRTTNFETANISKIANAAATQIEAIKKIKKCGKFNCLDEISKELANLRIKNPEMSLRELGENLSIPLTRSGVNHKMKKILNISENM